MAFAFSKPGQPLYADNLTYLSKATRSFGDDAVQSLKDLKFTLAYPP